MILLCAALARSQTQREWINDTYFHFTYRSNFGWKHPMALPDKKRFGRGDVAFITITKNPYAWLLSLYKRPYQAQKSYGSFRSFLIERWPVVSREKYDKPAFENPTAMWCEKNRSYRRLTDYAPNCINLRYEDLLADPILVLEKIETSLGLKRRTTAWKIVQESTNGEDKSFSDYQDYYLRERWKEKLDPEAIGVINRGLDRPLVEGFGYDVLSAHDVSKPAPGGFVSNRAQPRRAGAEGWGASA